MKKTDFPSLMRWADKPLENPNPALALLHSLVRVILITFSELKHNELSLRSGALTYTVLISLVPVLAMSTAVAKGLGGGDQLKELAYSYINTLEQETIELPQLVKEKILMEQTDVSGELLLPQDITGQSESDLTSHLREALDILFDYVDKTNFATLGTIGVAGLFLSVILVLGNIEMAMNAIWHVTKSRSVMRKIADYLTLLVLTPISVSIAFTASAFLKNPALASKIDLLIPFLWIQTLILKLIPVFFIAITLLIMYLFFPNTRVKLLPASLGALLAAILWFGVQNLYISMQVGVSKYNAIYGSFATLPLFLIWMYLGWLFILGGAQFSYACQHNSRYRLLPTPSTPAKRLGAAFDILKVTQACYQQGHPLSITELLEQVQQYDRNLLVEIVEELTSAELLYIASESGRILPPASSEFLDYQQVADLILGMDAADTDGGKMSLQAIQGATKELGK